MITLSVSLGRLLAKFILMARSEDQNYLTIINTGVGWSTPDPEGGDRFKTLIKLKATKSNVSGRFWSSLTLFGRTYYLVKPPVMDKETA